MKNVCMSQFFFLSFSKLYHVLCVRVYVCKSWHILKATVNVVPNKLSNFICSLYILRKPVLQFMCVHVYVMLVCFMSIEHAFRSHTCIYTGWSSWCIHSKNRNAYILIHKIPTLFWILKNANTLTCTSLSVNEFTYIWRWIFRMMKREFVILRKLKS